MFLVLRTLLLIFLHRCGSFGRVCCAGSSLLGRAKQLGPHSFVVVSLFPANQQLELTVPPLQTSFQAQTFCPEFHFRRQLPLQMDARMIREVATQVYSLLHASTLTHYGTHHLMHSLIHLLTLTHIITHSLTHSLAHSLTYALTHSVTSLTCSVTHANSSLTHTHLPTHSPTHSLINSPTHSTTHTHTHTHTQTHTHSLTHSLTQSLANSLTHSCTHTHLPHSLPAHTSSRTLESELHAFHKSPYSPASNAPLVLPHSMHAR